MPFGFLSRLSVTGDLPCAVSAYPGCELHVIPDNLNTSQKNQHWLKKHPKVQFHFTRPASWLNLVEVWFSSLQSQSLSGAFFTAVKELQEHIDAFIRIYNDKVEPFLWTKKKVRQRLRVLVHVGYQRPELMRDANSNHGAAPSSMSPRSPPPSRIRPLPGTPAPSRRLTA